MFIVLSPACLLFILVFNSDADSFATNIVQLSSIVVEHEQSPVGTASCDSALLVIREQVRVGRGCWESQKQTLHSQRCHSMILIKHQSHVHPPVKYNCAFCCAYILNTLLKVSSM